MANTTNYNWETPDDTDLVKDGAAAIRTLGNSIDTTTKNLNPETTTGDIAYRSATANTNTRLPIGSTGQVLTVAAGVPSWATPTDQTPLTTKGDVFTFSTVDARLGVGANGTVLTADSAETTGLKWAAPAGGGGYTQLASGSLSGSSLSLTSISASYRNLQLVLRNWQNGSVGYASVRLNNLSTGIYDNLYFVNQNATVVTAASIGATSITANYNSLQASSGDRPMIIDVFDYANTSADKLLFLQTNYIRANTNREGFVNYGCVRTTSAIDRIDFIIDTGTFGAGTYSLYGVK